MANVRAVIGSEAVVSIDLVADGSWVTDPQTFDFDNVDISGTTYTFEPVTPADRTACMNGGWAGLTRSDFSGFKSQGDCIQYTNTGT